MISGIGFDMIDITRIKDRVNRESGFREYVFHPNEISYCEKMSKKEQHYAARFAAKEALLKALGTGLQSGLTLNEIEVMNDSLGKPSFAFHGNSKNQIQSIGDFSIQLSLSHLETVAGAVVVIESKA